MANGGSPPGKGLRSAQTFAQRKRSAAGVKGKGRPLGGAPPIPEGKMAGAVMPKPTFEIPYEDPPPIHSNDRAVPPSQGVGSAYPVNQNMAAGGKQKSLSQAKREGLMDTSGTQGRGPSEETAAALQAIHNRIQESDREPPPPPQEPKKEDESELDQELMDKAEEEIAESSKSLIDFEALSGVRNNLMSEERRKAVESRLKKLDISDMVMSREIQQEVTIIPGKLSLTYRTMNEREHLFCLRHVYEHQGSAAYMEEMFNVAKLACSLLEVNGAPLPEHRKNVGKPNEEVDEENFKLKLFHLCSFPVQFLAEMSVQGMWFNDRINDLFSVENLKNG